MLAEHPFTLPRLRPTVQVPTPEQPTEPPSDGDLVAARVYYTIIRDLSDERELSDEKRPTTAELTDALRYLQDIKDRIWADRGDPIQELGRQMNQRFNEMSARFDRIEEMQTVIVRRLNNVSRQQSHSSILPLMEANTRADGINRTLVVVPFQDGSWPTEDPHNLPPLYTLEDIDALREDQRVQYCRGYGFTATGNVAQQKATIRRAVGMSH
ncbi:hypothetical protein V1517DRAFT_330701 [Lipomyces orientalis]|uniref:Uncharacterized protein n=1 Tax=Lipomyces orientalis TaxID=1233043 RepID=A0ACC3TG96_9ASCO